MTIHVWFDYGYYDGLLAWRQGCFTGEGRVSWCGEELPRVAMTS